MKLKVLTYDKKSETFIWSPGLPAGIAAAEAARVMGLEKPNTRFYPLDMQVTWFLFDGKRYATFKQPISAFAMDGGVVELVRG